MCDVCNLEGKDWKFHNSPRITINQATFYRVYLGQVAKVKLCHLHTIENFLIGESRFLKEHLSLAVDMGRNRNNYTQSSEGENYVPASVWF